MTQISGNSTRLSFQDQNFTAQKTRTSLASTGIVDQQKVGDGVLDLSDTSRLGDELQESADSVQVVKVGGQFLSLSQEQVSSLIDQLKTLYSQKDVSLNMLVAFDKGSGIQVTQTQLSQDQLSQAGKISQSTQDVINKGAEFISLSQRGEDQHSTVGHSTAASRLNYHMGQIDKQMGVLQTQIDSLAAQGITAGPEVEDLKAQKQVLQSMKEVMDATRAIHLELAKIPNLPDKATAEAQLQTIETLNQNLADKITAMNTTLAGAKDKIANGGMAKNAEKLASRSGDVQTHLKEAISLARNPMVISSRQAYGMPAYLPGLVTQYEQFLKLAKNGEAVRANQPQPFAGVGYLNRPGETPDPQGFVQFCKDGVNDSQAFAQKFEGVGKDIEAFFAQPNLSESQIAAKKTEIQAQLKAMFTNQGGQYIIKEEIAAKIGKIYTDQFDVAHCKHLVAHNTAFVRDDTYSSKGIDHFFEKKDLTPAKIAEHRAEMKHHLEEYGHQLSHDFHLPAEVAETYINQAMAEFDEAHSAWKAEHSGVANINSGDEELGESLMANQQADKLNDNIGTARVTEFGNTANSVANTQNQENITEATAAQTQVDQNLSDIHTIQGQQLNSSSHQLSHLGKTLETMAPGSKFEAYVGFGVQLGGSALGGAVQAEVKAGAKISFTVEKAFGNGPPYRMHFDFTAKVEANVKLFGFLEAKLGAEWSTTLAAIGFRDEAGVQEYVNGWQDLIENIANGDMDAAEASWDKLGEIEHDNAYSSEKTKVYGSVESKATHSGFGGEVSTSYSEYPIEDKSKKWPLSKATEFVKAESEKKFIKVHGFEVEMVQERTASYTDNTYSRLQPPRCFGNADYRPTASRTVVEAKIPGHILMHAFKLGSVAEIPAPLLAGMVVQMRTLSAGLAGLSDNEVVKMLEDGLAHALTDAVLVSKLTAIAEAKLPHGGPVEAEFMSTIAFEVTDTGHMAVEVGFEAKIEAEVDIPVGTGVSVYGEAGVEIKYAKTFTIGGHH
ncbi:MAG: hypothetical protein ACAI44_09605 [Candidatus Sericytochromatia bacterium]